MSMGSVDHDDVRVGAELDEGRVSQQPGAGMDGAVEVHEVGRLRDEALDPPDVVVAVLAQGNVVCKTVSQPPKRAITWFD